MQRFGWPIFALVLVSISLGAGHVSARLAFLNGVSVLTGATVRSLLVLIILGIYLSIFRRNLFPPKAGIKAALALGVLLTLQTLGIQYAVKLLPVTLAILLFYTHPVFTGVSAWLTGKEPLTKHQILVFFFAFLGIGLVLGVNPEPISPLGVLAALIASTSFSAVFLLTPRIAGHMRAADRTFLMFASTGILITAISVGTESLGWPTSINGWWGLLGLTVFYATGVIGLFFVLPLLGPTQTAVILNLEPVAVALIAWITLDEKLNDLQIFGGLMIIAAIITYRLAAPKITPS